jgi:predicted HicB family RNase H-like nuclease
MIESRQKKISPMLTYKGHTGRFEVDVNAGVIFGRVLGIRDVVTFKGTHVEEAKQAFFSAVDDYLTFCQEQAAIDSVSESA